MTARPAELAALLPIRRAHCAGCGRPQSAKVDACICRWVTPLAPGANVLILQHPMETHNPKGTARLLHLSLPGSQLMTGEVFAPDVLQAALHGPSASGRPLQPVLLYPANGVGLLVNAAALPAAEGVRLVVLDGTWRKSRKMLHVNPLLQGLPRLALAGAAASRYVIRKAHAPHQLSTLEATCAALEQLSGQPGQFAPLLAAMDGWMAQQAAFSRSVERLT